MAINNFEIVTSQRGKPQVLYEGKLYSQKPRNKTKKAKVYTDIYWTCTSNRNKCTASIVTDINITSILSTSDNHRPDCQQLSQKEQQYRKMYNSAKRKATEDVGDPPETVVTKKLRLADDKDKLQTNDLKNLKHLVYRERNRDIPHNIPKNVTQVFDQVDDIKLSPSFMTGSTSLKEQYIYPFKQFGILFMTCITNLMWLCDSDNEHYLVDGTFSHRPKYFEQLYTIHVYRSGHYMALVHVALPGKSEEIYNLMWTLLKQLCWDLCGKVLIINSLLVDYELAAINSVRNHYQGLITGCRFHLSQAWFRFIQKNNYLAHYSDDESPIGKWLRAFFGLSFLPASMIDDAYLLLQARKPSQECDKFIDYITDNYIDDHVANFPPNLWAREVLDSRDVRTTNGPEAFHCRYNSHFKVAQPNIYKVLQALLLNQEKNFLIFNDLTCGLEKKQAKPQLNKDDKVRETWVKYLNSQRTDDDLWKYLSFLGNRYKGKKL